MILVETPETRFQKWLKFVAYLWQRQFFTINYIHYCPQTKLRKGNVSTSMCQEFCPQGGVYQTPPGQNRQTPPG